MPAIDATAAAARPPHRCAPTSGERLHAAETLASQAGRLWRGSQLAAPAQRGCSTGFDVLDAELPGGGWPTSGLTELLLREAGCGEIRLLAPALARMAGAAPSPLSPSSTGAMRDVVWVAPPHPPYAPALQALGLPIARLVWIQTTNEADAAWAAEQVLHSGAACAVLWWSAQPLPTSLRRLHLAAQEGGTPLFTLRPWAHLRQSSPAPLRMAVEPLADGHLQVRLIKRRGPPLAQPLNLALPHLPFKETPGRAPRQQPRVRQAPLPFSPSQVADVVAVAAPAVAAA